MQVPTKSGPSPKSHSLNFWTLICFFSSYKCGLVMSLTARLCLCGVWDAGVPDVPEGVDWSLWVPQFNDFRLMKTQQCLHRLLRHVRHRLLVNQGHEAVDQLQGTALDLMTCLAGVLQQIQRRDVNSNRQYLWYTPSGWHRQYRVPRCQKLQKTA